jgi:hypothetical protein
VKKPKPFAWALAAAMIGSALLFAAEPTVGNPPAGSEEPDDRPGRDQDLDQLNEMMTPACGININQQSNLCGRDIDEDEPFSPIVAPPTGGEGSSNVLPIIQDRDETGNENRNTNDQVIEQSNDCIGYECGSATAAQNVSGSQSEQSGYFNADFTGRSDVPPKTPNAANADSSATQSEPGVATGYFNSDYTARSDVPPMTQGNDARGEIPVSVTLVPVAIDRTKPPSAGQVCTNQSGQSCVNTPLVDHPAEEPPETHAHE